MSEIVAQSSQVSEPSQVDDLEASVWGRLFPLHNAYSKVRPHKQWTDVTKYRLLLCVSSMTINLETQRGLFCCVVFEILILGPWIN